jgi:hypothetical protein
MEHEREISFLFFPIKRKETFSSFSNVYHLDTNKFGVVTENTILSVNSQIDQRTNQWKNKTLVPILSI